MQTCRPLRLDQQTRRTIGFSLIETVLALSIISFALIGLMGLIPVGLNVTAQTLQKAAANQIATQIIRGYQQANYSGLSSSMTSSYYLFDGAECKSTDDWIYQADTSTNLSATVSGVQQLYFGTMAVKITTKGREVMHFTASLADRGT